MILGRGERLRLPLVHFELVAPRSHGLSFCCEFDIDIFASSLVILKGKKIIKVVKPHN